jgi:hypothetical protein
VLAEVAELVAPDDRRGRGRDEHLPAVSGSGDPSGPVDVGAHVALLRHLRRAGVNPHADAERTPRERALRLPSCRHGLGRRGKGHEEGVALSVHLDPAVRGARAPQGSAVLGKRLGVPVRAEFVQRLGRALDVREQERDGAGGQSAWHGPHHAPVSALRHVAQSAKATASISGSSGASACQKRPPSRDTYKRFLAA